MEEYYPAHRAVVACCGASMRSSPPPQQQPERESDREKERERERLIDPHCCSVAAHLNSSRSLRGHHVANNSLTGAPLTVGPYISSAAVRWRTLAALR